MHIKMDACAARLADTACPQIYPVGGVDIRETLRRFLVLVRWIVICLRVHNLH